MSPEEYIARGQAARSRTIGCASNAVLSANSSDNLNLTPAERKNASACIAGDLDLADLTKRELRAVALTRAASLRAAGAFAQ